MAWAKLSMAPPAQTDQPPLVNAAAPRRFPVALRKVRIVQALRRAARESWDLPDGSVLQIGEEPTEDLSEGAISYAMASDGHLTPLRSAREEATV